jgi:hypothetical protein
VWRPELPRGHSGTERKVGGEGERDLGEDSARQLGPGRARQGGVVSMAEARSSGGREAEAGERKAGRPCGDGA